MRFGERRERFTASYCQARHAGRLRQRPDSFLRSSAVEACQAWVISLRRRAGLRFCFANIDDAATGRLFHRRRRANAECRDTASLFSRHSGLAAQASPALHLRQGGEARRSCHHSICHRRARRRFALLPTLLFLDGRSAHFALRHSRASLRRPPRLARLIRTGVSYAARAITPRSVPDAMISFRRNIGGRLGPAAVMRYTLPYALFLKTPTQFIGVEFAAPNGWRCMITDDFSSRLLYSAARLAAERPGAASDERQRVARFRRTLPPLPHSRSAMGAALRYAEYAGRFRRVI